MTVATRRYSRDYIGKSSNHRNYKVIARLYFVAILKVFKHSRFYCFNKRHSSVESFLKHLHYVFRRLFTLYTIFFFFIKFVVYS